MINEKTIIETLANQTERLASLQETLAAFIALVESRLQNLSPQEKEMLKKGVVALKSDSEALKFGAEKLRLDVQKM